jgi:hypothetical protein
MPTYTSEGGLPLDITEETVARIHALHTLTGTPVADLCSTATELLRQQLVPSTKPTAVKAGRPKKSS